MVPFLMQACAGDMYFWKTIHQHVVCGLKDLCFLLCTLVMMTIFFSMLEEYRQTGQGKRRTIWAFITRLRKGHGWHRPLRCLFRILFHIQSVIQLSFSQNNFLIESRSVVCYHGSLTEKLAFFLQLEFDKNHRE